MRNAIACGVVLAAAVTASAAIPRPLRVEPGSRVWVDGSSNTSLWHCESGQPRGSVAASTAVLARIGRVPRAEIVIPVATLVCHNETMDTHLRNALKAHAAAEIHFVAERVSLTAATDSEATAVMRGRLSVAGESHGVRVAAVVTQENGALRVRGSKRLLMTDWGIARPTMMRSEVVDPEVTVGFDVTLKP